MKHIKLFENFEKKLDIPYQFIEEVKDLLTEYEDQGMYIRFYVMSYINQNHIYDYMYNRTKIVSNMYYDYKLNDILILYKKHNISLNQFVYWIYINDNKELAIKFVNRLKQIYPNINLDISRHDIKMYLDEPDYKLNDKTYGVYFILD